MRIDDRGRGTGRTTDMIMWLGADRTKRAMVVCNYAEKSRVIFLLEEMFGPSPWWEKSVWVFGGTHHRGARRDEVRIDNLEACLQSIYGPLPIGDVTL